MDVFQELKTPLTTISGCAKIMTNGMAKSKDAPEFSEKIYREVQRLIVLINDRMLLSGLEENIQSVRESVDLLQLSEYVSGEPTMVYGIPSVLDELVYNLIDNAINHLLNELESGAKILWVRSAFSYLVGFIG